MSVASASQHLRRSRARGWSRPRREGLYIHYRLADQDVFRTWLGVRALAESRLAEVEGVVEAYLENQDALEAVDATELMERLSNENVVVLDVRPKRSTGPGTYPGLSPCP